MYILYTATALFVGFDKIVQMLIDKGANVEVVDDKDKTAFLYAAQNLWTVMYLSDQEIP